MAIEGDLKDLSLSSLVQILCQARRRASLQVSRRGEEGVIYLADGEIVHSCLGLLEGEDAVYRLLSWSDGLFRVSIGFDDCPRTIGKSLNFLLLEGTRQHDERVREEAAGNGAAERPLSRSEEEFDRGFEAGLFTLIAELEQVSARLHDPKTRRRPVRALAAVEELVNRVAEFAGSVPGAAQQELSMVKLMARVASSYPQVRILDVADNRISFQAAARLYTHWAGDPAERPRTFRQLCRAAASMIEEHFMRVAAYLHSASRRELWRETCGVYLVELNRIIEALEL
ncbi:MAG TPA: DUF4388 domain-containing protein [Thermoanaerobaculia bacterium]|nr:DUF4388 domain-containing protein [Thermoanaerobaculia bacterium]